MALVMSGGTKISDSARMHGRRLAERLITSTARKLKRIMNFVASPIRILVRIS